MWHFTGSLPLERRHLLVSRPVGRRYPLPLQARGSAPRPANILLVWLSWNTVYPQIWKQCDGGVLFAKQHSLRLDYPYGFRLTFHKSPMWALAAL